MPNADSSTERRTLNSGPQGDIFNWLLSLESLAHKIAHDTADEQACRRTAEKATPRRL